MRVWIARDGIDNGLIGQLCVYADGRPIWDDNVKVFYTKQKNYITLPAGSFPKIANGGCHEAELTLTKTDGRAVGLNNEGYPLRRVLEKKDGLHHLECGHSLQPIGSNTVRWRRCIKCSKKD